ncbi:MAG: T9SS type A sorting domain-containing protein [Aureispira sp.]|nr:T9SS type A sorting domain-containing protein [Aureispira sp.]
MKNFVLLLTFMFGGQVSFTQNSSCNNTQRYRNTVDFPNINTTTAIQFGSGTTVGGVFQNLLMDIYQPVGDTASSRPLIILAFGGGFVSGNRQNMLDLCQYYTKRGYVTASIDYRLYDIFATPDSTMMGEVVIRAINDMKAAIRFFREDAATNNIYKIDSNFIFVGGESAGAIIANHTAYMDSTDALEPFILNAINNNGGYLGNSSSNTQYSTKVAGVLNFSGSLRSAAYIDANNPALFSAHDDQDGDVPYGGGYSNIIPLYTQGSKLMHDTAISNNIHSELITIPNSTGHISYFNTTVWKDSVLNSSTQFMRDIICSITTSTTNIQEQKISTITFPNPSFGDMTIQLSDVPCEYNVAVFDATGRLVHQANNLADQEINLNGQQFAKGMYFVSIQFHDSKVRPIQQKIIFR